MIRQRKWEAREETEGKKERKRESTLFTGSHLHLGMRGLAKERGFYTLSGEINPISQRKHTHTLECTNTSKTPVHVRTHACRHTVTC